LTQRINVFRKTVEIISRFINENTPKQASGYQREMHYDETPRFLKLFPL
jgi:hypothetical protein